MKINAEVYVNQLYECKIKDILLLYDNIFLVIMQ